MSLHAPIPSVEIGAAITDARRICAESGARPLILYVIAMRLVRMQSTCNEGNSGRHKAPFSPLVLFPPGEGSHECGFPGVSSQQAKKMHERGGDEGIAFVPSVLLSY